ncbi:sigma-54-dependent transcriptional regulator [Gynuella sp.]|uniref:sigma-54-dependent transcriptional regulator n=1 Tax=Gynuella sp. TaxID=2969146 RepID=UPI003D0E9BDE
MDTLATALIIDDEPDIVELLEITLGRMGLGTIAATTLAQAQKLLAEKEIHICLTDMNLPDGNGLDLVETIQQKYSNIPVAVISAHGTMDSAIDALKRGAFDFVSKPVDLQQLRDLVHSALKLANRIRMPEQETSRQSNLIGKSEPFLELLENSEKLARSQAAVFINGESGTGKELIARYIHNQGPRAEQPFIAVNCGAIPSELMESEFFGHKKGSFTGAIADKEGFFQAANGGTLFLDEVADLPLNMQVKLLRAIQEKSIRPVGSQKELPVNVRILSASHKNLLDEVEDQNFRQDLFYRINVIQLDIPPLRERFEDIPLLAHHYLEKLATSYGVRPRELSRSAQEALQIYDFPGNIRELENILERAFAMSDGVKIEPKDLALRRSDSSNSASSGSHLGTLETPEYEAGSNLEDYLESIERKVITDALEATRWNKTAAAKNLGITFRAMRYKLKKLGLE